MPIKIPNELPARATLEAEGVMLMREADAVRQDIRPMRIGLLNLMPNKIRTETQFARLLGVTPLQVELTLVKMTNHVARNTPSDHIISFYRDFGDIRAEKFDGFIVTGAPVSDHAPLLAAARIVSRAAAEPMAAADKRLRRWSPFARGLHFLCNQGVSGC